MSTPSRLLNIATGKSRFEKSWKNRPVEWPNIVKKLSEPARSLDKDQGGYVAGYLRDGLRRGGHAEMRSMITLDADENAGDDFPVTVDMELLGNAYVLHETHSSTPDTRRWRLIVPLAEDISAEAYVPAALALMERLGLERFDPTTAQPERLMYWPVRKLGADFEMIEGEGEFLDAEELLADYPDWRDSTCWPDVAHAYRTGEAKKAGDPREKRGVVGAFNRAYPVTDAISTFLSDVYTEAPGDRWTYVDGRTIGGLAVYDDDTFAYSNHGSDPAEGRLLSAFDLVRIHLFGHLDSEVPAETPLGSLPSQVAMVEKAGEDANVRVELDEGRHLQAVDDFEPMTAEEVEENTDELRRSLSSQLARDRNGKAVPTADNLRLILDLDPGLAGVVGHDMFAHRLTLRRDLPWRKVSRAEPYWIDDDDAGLRAYIETQHGIVAVGKIADALSGAARRNAFHPVRDYLEGLSWDGTARLDTLLVDYLGAEDTPYVRAVTRKALVAAVTRIYVPGAKFDHMIVTTGAQGIGKSTIPARLAGNWFKDSLEDVRGKDAYEALSGCWIMEMGEMTATKKAEVEAVKQFVSSTEDNFRAAYARRSEHRPRQIIFWGTSNDHDFLRDRTGNRRFWPVPVTGRGAHRPWDLTPETVGQVWAEAKHLFEAGERLVLSVEEERLAAEAQLAHTETNDLDGMVLEYLDLPISADWYKLPIEERRTIIRDGADGLQKTKLREKVCATEVCVEMLGERPGGVHPAKRAQVIAALDNTPGWSRSGKARFGVGYGVQVAWVRDAPEDDLI